MAVPSTSEPTAPLMSETPTRADTGTPYQYTGSVSRAKRTTTSVRKTTPSSKGNADSHNLSSGLLATTPQCHLDQYNLMSQPEEVRPRHPAAERELIRDPRGHQRWMIRRPTAAARRCPELIAVTRPRLVAGARPSLDLRPHDQQCRRHLPHIQNLLYGDDDLKLPLLMKTVLDGQCLEEQAAEPDPLTCLTGPGSTSRTA